MSSSSPSSYGESSDLDPSSSGQFPDSSAPNLMGNLPVLRGSSSLAVDIRDEAGTETDMDLLSADPVTCVDTLIGEAKYVHDLRGELEGEFGPYCCPGVRLSLPSSSNSFGGNEIRVMADGREGKIGVGGVGVGDEVHESGVDQTEAEDGGVGETDAEGEGGDDVRPGMLDEWWRQQMITADGEEIANRIYHIPDGYHLHLPASGSSVHDPPGGHVVVYLRPIEVGLRFPLHRRVEFILCRMNVSLA